MGWGEPTRPTVANGGAIAGLIDERDVLRARLAAIRDAATEYRCGNDWTAQMQALTRLLDLAQADQ